MAGAMDDLIKQIASDACEHGKKILAYQMSNLDVKYAPLTFDQWWIDYKKKHTN